MNEDTLIQRLLDILPDMTPDIELGPGDDCAAIPWINDTLLLVTVDQLIGDRHYLRSGNTPTEPRRIGRKLLARNISDIAAMGGQPRSCLVTMAFPSYTDTERLELIAEGIAELARQFDIAVIGGDIATTPTDEVFTLTMMGQVARDQICRRSTASPGDVLCMTGAAGASFETDHHLDFTPRTREAQWLAQHRFPTAMIDVSDGLALDALRIATASKLQITLDLDAIPRRNPDEPVEKAIADGEDYELLFTVNAENIQALLDQWPFDEPTVTPVGSCRSGKPDVLNNHGESLNRDNTIGFDHLDNTQ